MEEIISKIVRSIIFYFVKIHTIFVYYYSFFNFNIPYSKNSQVTTKYQRNISEIHAGIIKKIIKLKQQSAKQLKSFNFCSIFFNKKFYRNLTSNLTN
jgi:hypothetical protein